MRKVKFTLELRGQRVNVDAEVVEPDSTVGYMHSFIDDSTLVLRNEEGEELPWVLTQDEWEMLNGSIPEDFFDA